MFIYKDPFLTAALYAIFVGLATLAGGSGVGEKETGFDSVQRCLNP